MEAPEITADTLAKYGTVDPADIRVRSAPTGFALEFANPWHDEAGRFAPKGTGRSLDLAGTPLGEFKNIEVSDDFDEAAQAAINDGIARIAQTFPELVDAPVIERIEASADDRNYGSYGGGEVRLHPDLSFHDSAADDGWTVAGGAEATVIHEMGHGFLGAVFSEGVSDTDLRSFAESRGFTGDWDAEKSAISRYATTSPHELLAEAFTQRVVFGSEASKLAVYLTDGAVDHIASGAVFDGFVASAISEFANPWHDEAGRFAPKGTGTKFGELGAGDYDALAAGYSQTENAGTNVAERQSRLQYTGDGFREINADVVFYRQLAADSDGRSTVESLLKAQKKTPAGSLHSLFEKKGVPLPSDTVVHRGEFSDDALPEMTVGESFRPRGFMSTTTSDDWQLDTFLDGSGHGSSIFTEPSLPKNRRHLVIEAPSGTKVIPGRAHEKELIFSHETEMDVQSTEMVDGVEVVRVRVRS